MIDMKLIAIYKLNPATKAEIKHRLKLYKKDLAMCKADLKIKYKNGNPDGMPDAVKINRDECKRRIAYYIPAINELKWVLGKK
jgi:hypothetical protein